MAFRFRELHLRDALAVGIPAILILVAGFWFAAQYVKPAPPRYLVMSTGAEGGGYQAFAARYKSHLESYGIELRERPSAGAVENLQRLLDPNEGVDVGFVQGGLGLGTDAEGLVSLGSFYHEPLWIFYRGRETLDQLAQLKNKRIAVGGEGSGTRRLALELLEASGIRPNQGKTAILPLGGLAAVAALASGEIDAAILVGPAQSGAVWSALFTPGAKLMSLTHAEAYARRFPYLTKLTLPRGGIDVARDVPANDVTLVATMATIVAREDVHPALIDLLLSAAQKVHGGPGLFQRPGEFPNANQVDFPLSREAERFYKSGRRILHRYLPFWAATLVERTIVLLVPVFALLIPIMRFAPALYGWRIRRRIFRWYGELKFLEQELESNPGARTAHEWLDRLDRIESRVHHVKTPVGFANLLYTLREHIALVRQMILRRTGGTHTGPPVR